MANHEESHSLNQNKIILYHGETYGVWLFQLILKAFKYPEAPEDWLPLRYGNLDKDIDKTDLMRLIKNDRGLNDHQEKYTKIGLAVSPNLFGKSLCESAWGSVCMMHKDDWHKISGYSSETELLHKTVWRYIKENFVTEAYWKAFIKQKKLINQFIQIKRKQFPAYLIKDYQNQFKTAFPKTFKAYNEEFSHLKYEGKENHFCEGVLLQIIMDRKLANDLVYDSYSFGFVKSKKHNFVKKFMSGTEWTGQEIEPYSDIYDQVKNKDFESQARVAMNKDFREFPSRIRIKSITGIMEHPKDYEILKSMIREMVEFFIQKKEERPLEKKENKNLFSKIFGALKRT